MSVNADTSSSESESENELTSKRQCSACWCRECGDRHAKLARRVDELITYRQQVEDMIDTQAEQIADLHEMLRNVLSQSRFSTRTRLHSRTRRPRNGV